MIRWLNLGVAFLLELTVLFAVGNWGFTQPWDSLMRFAAGLGAPLSMAVIWGALGSPKASVPLGRAANAAFRIAWFGVGALAFAITGHPIAGLSLAGVYAVNAVVLGRL